MIANTYDPYGTTLIATRNPLTGDFEVKNASAFGNPFAWTSQRYDVASGTYHFLFRTYSPILGRWLQRDPLGHLVDINDYQYTISNPLVWIDRLGLEPEGVTPPTPRPPPEGWPENFKWDGERWTWRAGEGHTMHEGHYDSPSRRLYPETLELQQKKNPKVRTRIGAKPLKGLRRAAGVTAGAGAGILLGILTESAEAIDHFGDPKKSPACHAWYRAALKGDCNSMREYQDECRNQLVEAKLEKVAMTFDIAANKAHDACMKKQQEEEDKKKGSSCSGSSGD